MEGSPEFEAESSENSDALVLSNNLVYFLFCIGYENPQLIFPVDPAYHLRDVKFRKYFHEDLQENLLRWISVILQLQLHFSKFHTFLDQIGTYLMNFRFLNSIIKCFGNGYFPQPNFLQRLVPVMNKSQLTSLQLLRNKIGNTGQKHLRPVTEILEITLQYPCVGSYLHIRHYLQTNIPSILELYFLNVK